MCCIMVQIFCGATRSRTGMCTSDFCFCLDSCLRAVPA